MALPAVAVKLPDKLRSEIEDAFDEFEMRNEYEESLRLTAEKCGVSCTEVEAVLIERDELDNGNC